LIINDQFGALAVALHDKHPHSWGDSHTARLALQENLARNNLGDNAVFILSTTAPADRYDAVLWRIPKSIALLRQQAARLQPLLRNDTLVLAGGMVKHLTAQATDILRELGHVDILPAQKKARIFQITPDPTLPALVLAEEKNLLLPEYQLQLSGDANVFARDKFDIGARFFLQQFAQLPPSQRIADLGCGNGVLGIVAKQLQNDAQIYFFDESYQAVAAAERNYRNNIAELESSASFQVDDGFSNYSGELFDLILCNPPFHQSHTVGDQIAWRMFTQSLKNLRTGGQLWIVGNRHLNYHIKLKRLFGNCRQITADNKFVVLATTKR
jgi:16S rRNA G1207 methylase RsmC